MKKVAHTCGGPKFGRLAPKGTCPRCDELHNGAPHEPSICNRTWRARNPEKVKAHWTVGNAIRYGKLKRLPCEKCGSEKSHAHHSDYSKPLDIKWLCHKCHWKEHGWETKPRQKKTYRRTRTESTAIGITRSDAKWPVLIKLAIELRSKGLSYRLIAKQLNITKGTVYKWINNPSYK